MPWPSAPSRTRPSEADRSQQEGKQDADDAVEILFDSGSFLFPDELWPQQIDQDAEEVRHDDADERTDHKDQSR